ncbi:ArsC family reductase [Burkholderia sp. L27(2015)]|jgi:arsenate reductase|uniref:ArsC family reductase n=1 Tax=Burkholderia sp. L27(2015) TaxID=1641858 RepID=UPI00131CC3D1|nr:ArsC family reductase [Burkholderia sp. L27(2015)]
MTMVVYGIPNCDTVKKARTWLADRDVDFDFHDFKKRTLSAALLQRWLDDVPLDILLNRRGTTWRALSDAQKAAAQTSAGAIAVMIENPSVIKRPVVEVDGHVVAVGFIADEYAARFK